jgi:hypothetical protein
MFYVLDLFDLHCELLAMFELRAASNNASGL